MGGQRTGVFLFCSAKPGELPNVFDPLAARNWRIFGQWADMTVKIGGQDFTDAYPQLAGNQYYSEITWDIGASLQDGLVNLTVKQKVVIAEYGA